MFYVSGNEFAAWMPDGTRLGSSRLIGSESTPEAAERMAAAFRSAEREEGGAHDGPGRIRLRNGAAIRPASALFVPTRDVSALLAVCTRLGLDPTGRVFDVAGGFLLKLDRPTAEPIPGATRLRDPGPGLLPARRRRTRPGPARRRGGRPGARGGWSSCRAAVSSLRSQGRDRSRQAPDRAEPRPSRAWDPLPSRDGWPSRFVAIAWNCPMSLPRHSTGNSSRTSAGRRTARSVTTRAGDDGGRTSGSKIPGGAGDPGPRRRRKGRAEGRQRVGRGLCPGVQGLAASFRGLMGQAGAGFSAFREKLQWEWVDHSSLVRKLLHEFREGDPSRALRHAFSMAPADSRQPASRLGQSAAMEPCDL